jgi:hypothetical protein
MEVPLIVLVGHHIAMGPPLGLPCLRVVAPSSTASGSMPFPRNRPSAPLLPTPPHRCLERECVAAEADRGVAKLLRRWGCRATAPPIDTVAGPPSRGAPPRPRSPSYLRRRTAALSASEWLRRKYPEVRLAAAVFFFFFPIRDRFASPCRPRLSLRLPRLQRRRAWSSHHRRCPRLFRRWRHPLPVLDSSSSWHSIRVRAYCRFRADTAADVAEGRCPSTFQQPRLPSPSAAHRPAAVIGKKLLILCTRMPLLMLQTCALLHGLDHVHLDLGYFGTKGLSSA